PPGEKLPADVIADFEQWIADGAFDPREGQAVAKKRGLSIEEGRQFWSFIPPREPPLPKVARADWPLDPIDRFVLARMEERQLAPAADADPRTLVRRLYFDLIGLPPEEVEAFLHSTKPRPSVARLDEERDQSAKGGPLYEALVDQLLASPRFGERWGRHWLDVVRYADSNGRDRNIYYYHARRYRDYVIDAFNRDKPFDQFLREQIAGDL